MNPLTKVKLIQELNEREADLGIKEAVSWHTEYRDSAWVFVGGFPYELTEGDLICVFSQYGEIVNINLVRDKKTGKSKGFCFVCYEDQRSTILAVDNFNGIKIKGRTIRVDHVKNYRPPKDHEDIDDVTKRLREDGCAPTVPDVVTLSSDEEERYDTPVKKPKKDKKEKKKKKKEKKKKEKKNRSRSSSSSPSPPLPRLAVKVKEEKQDAAYDKYSKETSSGGHSNGQRTKDAERGRGEEEERWRGADRDGDMRRNRDRRDVDRDDRGRESERDRDSKDINRRDADKDRRRETDREDNKRRDSDRRQVTDRDSDRRRERERDGDRGRERDRR